MYKSKNYKRFNVFWSIYASKYLINFDIGIKVVCLCVISFGVAKDGQKNLINIFCQRKIEDVWPIRS